MSARKEFADVMKDGQDRYVIKDRAILGATTMVNVKMELAFVHKAGMADIALFVSIIYQFINLFITMNEYIFSMKQQELLPDCLTSIVHASILF